MRDLQIGLDAVDVFEPHQIERISGIAGGKPPPRDVGTRHRAAIALRLQHHVQRHRQPRGHTVLADRCRVGPGQPIDQADLAAILRRDIGAVHAIDDAGEHETRIGGIKLRAVEQLEGEAGADADTLVRQLGLVPFDISPEIRIQRFCDLCHRRQREQLRVGQRAIGRARRRHDAHETKAAAIELAQCAGIDDGGATLERRIERGPGGTHSDQQNNDRQQW